MTIPEDDSLDWLEEAELPPSLPWREEDSGWEADSLHRRSHAAHRLVFYRRWSSRRDGLLRRL